MECQADIFSPFSRIDAGQHFGIKSNVMSRTQREILGKFGHKNKWPFFILLFGENGSGKTHTLRACKAFMQNRFRKRSSVHMGYINSGYLTYRTLFKNIHPHHSLRAIENGLPGSEKTYIFFIDVPKLCSEKDLIHTISFMEHLYHLGNISFILSVSQQYQSFLSRNVFIKDVAFVHSLAPLTCDETKMLLLKRLKVSRHIDPNITGWLKNGSNEPEVNLSEGHPSFTSGAFEEVYRISSGNSRLSLITASTIYKKALEAQSREVDVELIRSIEIPNGFNRDGRGCLLGTGLLTLLEVFIDYFYSTPVPEHLLLPLMNSEFGWNFSLTRLRLNRLVEMKFLETYLKPSRCWLREYRLREQITYPVN